MQINYLNINDIKPYENNPRKNKDAVDYVAKSIQEFGFKNPIIIDKNNVIIAGHTRLEASKKLNLEEVPCIYADDLTPEQVNAYRLIDNKTNELSDWDIEKLKEELDKLEIDFDMKTFGFADFYYNEDKERFRKGSLNSRFLYRPFDVFITYEKNWREKKQIWQSLLKSGNGREDGLLGQGMKQLAKNHKTTLTGTSIFDPVLCEILLYWYSNKGDKVLDPFAGGSVRGVVSAFTERKYYGNDLSEEQIQANYKNWEELSDSKSLYGGDLSEPVWTVGDSLNIDDIIKEKDFDFMMTCPPYFDLEKYSDDENDLSNMDYEKFANVYCKILKKSVAMLKKNAFIAITVAEVRDKKTKQGGYCDFVTDTIKAMKDIGCAFYNEIILVNNFSTAPLRAGFIFEKSRKVTHVHQKVLIFLKGDVENIKNTMLEYDKDYINEINIEDLNG